MERLKASEFNLDEEKKVLEEELESISNLLENQQDSLNQANIELAKAQQKLDGILNIDKPSSTQESIILVNEIDDCKKKVKKAFQVKLHSVFKLIR